MKFYYVTNDESGIRRERSGKKFLYFLPNGKRITSKRQLNRIKTLKIPPGYTNVWISTKANGHIQAYGFDDKHRKQYIYHTKWRQKQEKNKFDHLLKFGQSLTKLRNQIQKDLKKTKLSKEKVTAAAIKFLDITTMRIGSPQYESYGLLSITKKHIKIHSGSMILDFEGKSKQKWHVEVYNKQLSDLIKRFEKYPGYKIFKYFGQDGELHPLKVADVNEYLKRVTGVDITAKEFRTWKGSVLYLHYLLKYKDQSSPVVQKICIEKVAKKLTNTPNVCKRAYIHPLLLSKNIQEKLKILAKFKITSSKLPADEFKLLKLLEQ